jgi:hypothetical protein
LENLQHHLCTIETFPCKIASPPLQNSKNPSSSLFYINHYIQVQLFLLLGTSLGGVENFGGHNYFFRDYGIFFAKPE